uniref:BTB domain-containing protein n=1 Tax=Panagrolaimus davidi TaxID=227884 RepID=A0A914PQ69_9BILA
MSNDLYSSRNNIYDLQCERFNAFKSQNQENAQFDVAFRIGSKKIYAHKFFLVSASETFKVMFSDRWKNNVNDIEIEIKNYEYDEFYQFLCFLYSGKCQISKTNVFQLTDMAEYYNVQTLSKLCDKFLHQTKHIINVKNVEEMFEFAQIYRLPNFRIVINNYIQQNIGQIIRDKQFSAHKKPFVEFLSTIERSGLEEDYFKAIHTWAEQQAMQLALDDEDFNLQEFVKTELTGIFSKIDFSKMRTSFILEFIATDKTFLFPPSKLYFILKEKVISCSQRDCQEEELFKTFYQLAEKEAILKQKIYSVETFSLENAIKSELSDVLPFIKFSKMKLKFIMDFIVPKEFLFSLPDIYNMLVGVDRQKDEVFKAIYRFTAKRVMKNRDTRFAKNFNLKEAIKAELSGFLHHFLHGLTTEFVTEYIEEVFRAVYKVAENEARRNKIYANISLNDAVEIELADILPKICFKNMNLQFLYEFIIEKSFPFSASELYKMLSDCQRDGTQEQQYLKAVYKVAENEARRNKIYANKSLNDAIKIEMAGILPKIRFENINLQFLNEFIIEKTFLFSASELYKMLRDCQRDVNHEQQYLKALYTVAEKEVLEKQKATSNTKFKLNEAIKKELSEFLPNVKFHLMTDEFLKDFVVAKGIITYRQAQDIMNFQSDAVAKNESFLENVINFFKNLFS